MATLSEVLVRVNRSSAVVKGGVASPAALSVSGTREVVGLGYGKSRQVPARSRRPRRDARVLQRIPRTEGQSIPHEVEWLSALARA